MACGTMECGNDPVCSMSCGTCTAPETCQNGTCVGPCTDDTDCSATQCCINQTCTEMACGGLQCGNDSVCNKSCGTCTAPATCQNGQCVGDGNLGDPCAYGDVNPTAGDCNAGLSCLGVAADGVAGTCPGGLDSECTGLIDEWNPDCVGTNCGASFCSEPCGAGRTCPQGFIDQDVGTPAECWCVPTRQGDGDDGDPCPWGDVNASYADCLAGKACLGNDDFGSCPGGSAAECTGIAPSYNADCVGGICGFSFPPVCYCLPEEAGTSQAGEPCPFTGGVHDDADFCASGLTCLGNGNTGTCPGGTAAECGIPAAQNPDCVNGVCGFSHCTAECDAGGNCEAGFTPETISGTCYCVPGEPGTAQAGDPCPFTGGVNGTAENCAPGLSCLGVPADGASGTCPGGLDSECVDIPASLNPDCVGTNCGYSVCAAECDANGNCPAGFAPEDVGDPPVCFCVPS
jgi:hypothetical protein